MIDNLTLDIIQCVALVVVPWLTYAAGHKKGFHIGTLATLNYLESQGVVEFEEPNADNE